MGTYFPILGHTQSVYTDAGSLCFGIAAFYLFLWNMERNQNKKRYWFYLVCCGFIWGMGTEIKFTVVTSFVAALIWLVWFAKPKALLHLLVPTGTIALIMVLCSVYIANLPSKEYRETWAYPTLIHFICLGLEGDGGYNMESEYLNTVKSIYGYAEKQAYSKEFFITHASAFFDGNHQLLKIIKNFAYGAMGAHDFFVSTAKEGFVQKYIAGDGEHNYGYRHRITSWWYVLLGLAAIGCAGSALKGGIKEQPDFCRSVTFLCVFGIMFYVMLSEANNRQLYNHLPWIACAACLGLHSITEVVEAVCGMMTNTSNFSVDK